jgi:hypothetical protein
LRADGNNRLCLTSYLFFKTCVCVFKDTRAKALRRFKFFLGVSLVNTFVFTFRVLYSICVHVYVSACVRACVGCGRVGGGAVRVRCGAYVNACGTGARAQVPPQKRQKFGGARAKLHPPPRKKSRFRRGGRLAKPLYSLNTTII